MRPIVLVALAAVLVGVVDGASAQNPRAGSAHSARPGPSGLLDSGTLVVVIPTADGAVIAADSRGTLSNGAVIDTERKIVRSADLPVAAFVTGTASASLTFNSRTRRTRTDFDVAATLQRELNRLDHIPDLEDFRDIVESVAGNIRRSRNAADGLLRNRLTVVGLVTFRRETAQTTIYTGRLGTDAEDNLNVDILPSQEIDSGSALHVRVYGEAGYAMAHVLTGAGRARLSPSTLRLLNVRTTVGQINAPAASAAARDIVQTVGRTMAEDRTVPVTVGGPTRSVLVGPYDVRVLGAASN